MGIATEVATSVTCIIGLTAVGVAASEISLRGSPRVGMAVVVRAVETDAGRELVLPVAIAIARISRPEGVHALGGLRLVAHDTDTSTTEHDVTVVLVVQVVEVRCQRQLVLVGAAVGHALQSPAVVGAAASLHVTEGTGGILLLQPHIHHITLVIHVASHHLRQLALAVKHLDFVHRIGG